MSRPSRRTGTSSGRTSAAPGGLTPDSAVLVVHGFKGFKDWGFFPYVCERLAEAGHLVVSFNFSLNGTGPGLADVDDLDAFGRNTLTREVEDVRWMLDRLRAGEWSGGQCPLRIALLGHSRGGGVSVLTAAESQSVTALVTWGSVCTFFRWSEEHVQDWLKKGVTYISNARTGQEMPVYRALWDDLRKNRAKLDVLAAARRVQAPWLVVHGSEDTTVPVAEARQLQEAGDTATLQVIGGSGHTFETAHPMADLPDGLRVAVDVTLAHLE